MVGRVRRVEHIVLMHLWGRSWLQMAVVFLNHVEKLGVFWRRLMSHVSFVRSLSCVLVQYVCAVNKK